MLKTMKLAIVLMSLGACGMLADSPIYNSKRVKSKDMGVTYEVKYDISKHQNNPVDAKEADRAFLSLITDSNWYERLRYNKKQRLPLKLNDVEVSVKVDVNHLKQVVDNYYVKRMNELEQRNPDSTWEALRQSFDYYRITYQRDAVMRSLDDVMQSQNTEIGFFSNKKAWLLGAAGVATVAGSAYVYRYKPELARNSYDKIKAGLHKIWDLRHKISVPKIPYFGKKLSAE